MFPTNNVRNPRVASIEVAKRQGRIGIFRFDLGRFVVVVPHGRYHFRSGTKHGKSGNFCTTTPGNSEIHSIDEFKSVVRLTIQTLHLFYMAGKFSLNTGGVATLKQVVAGMPSGIVYDHKALEAAGAVTVASEADRANARRLATPAGVAYFTEA